MEDLNFFPAAVYRTPVFDLDKSMDACFDELKSYINDASVSFYSQIKDDTLQDLYAAKDNRLFSLWKYFNRAKYRATPFGRFSAITYVPLSTKLVEEQKMLVSDSVVPHCFQDWSETKKFKPDNSNILKNSSHLMANSTIYIVGDEYRYTAIFDGNCVLCRVPRSETLEFVLNCCAEKTQKQQLLLQLKSGLGETNARALRLIQELISNQLIWADYMPNITGSDFFSRINALPGGDKKYIIAERSLIGGRQDTQGLKFLPELIDFLNKSTPTATSRDLEQFKVAFQEKFDRQFIPLAVALDPELGIDFANLSLASAKRESFAIDQVFNSTGKNEKAEFMVNNELSAFLLAGLTNGGVIRLEEFKPISNNATPDLPNTITVLYHTFNQQAVIQSLGGCTANAILGRFTLCNDDIERLCKAIAATEEQANPGVTFFDVGFQGEGHVDNINRRKHLYQAELSLSGWSEHDMALRLDDIYVGVRNQEIVLYSAKLKKRIVPRIATAYNFRRADYSLYRFLSELQHQGIRQYLSCSLPQYFPGLEHYSRVEYKGIILSPETWRLKSSHIKQVLKKGEEHLLQFLTNWLSANNIKTRFNVGKGDQKLLFNPGDANDLKWYAAYCSQNSNADIDISEALIDDASEVVNQNGKPFFAERVLSVFHNRQVYHAVAAEGDIEMGHNNPLRYLYPGDDWVYLEIYSHASRANLILINALQKLLDNNAGIKKWFFIRYQKGGDHLRLRFQMDVSHQAYSVVNQLRALLQQELAAGLIADIQVKTYAREIERYGQGGITNAESFFCEDSKWVLSLLKKNLDYDELYSIALRTMTQLIDCSFTDSASKLQFVNKMCGLFSNEFKWEHADFKTINKLYETFRNQPSTDSKKVKFLNKGYLAAYNRYGAACHNNDAVAAFTADAIHMHVNRLFTTAQRKHEAILYQYLLKDMKRTQFHLKQTGQS